MYRVCRNGAKGGGDGPEVSGLHGQLTGDFAVNRVVASLGWPPTSICRWYLVI